MPVTDSKQAFKQYLKQKKAAVQSLSKADQNQVQRLEEQAVVKRIQKRERYASDDEYRTKQQASAKVSMRKKRTVKQNVVDKVSNDNSNDEIEMRAPSPVPVQEQEQQRPRFNLRNLF